MDVRARRGGSLVGGYYPPVTEQITRRLATPGDFDFAYGLYRELMHELTVELLPWNDVRQQQVVRDGIESGRVEIVLVGEISIGWIQVNDSDDAVELGQLYIAPPWQGRGIGTALIEAFVACGEADGKPTRLSVMRNNPRALNVYQRLGFVVREVDRIKYHLQRDLRGSGPRTP